MTVKEFCNNNEEIFVNLKKGFIEIVDNSNGSIKIQKSLKFTNKKELIRYKDKNIYSYFINKKEKLMEDQKKEYLVIIKIIKPKCFEA